MTLLVVGFFFQLSASATCHFQACTDSDGGNVPHVPGATTATVSCAAPGGPVNTYQQVDHDKCENGQHVEYICGAQNVPTPMITPCAKCTANGKACQKKGRGVHGVELAPANTNRE